MRIGELARTLGVSPDTVRFYERGGWLPSASRLSNGYREYGDEDAEHLRLLIDLRRLDLPLDTAAQVASWCHSGHCDVTTAELPGLLAERRRHIAERLESLRALDARLADLENHLRHAASGRQLRVVDGGACCAAAGSVTSRGAGGCAACAAD